MLHVLLAANVQAAAIQRETAVAARDVADTIGVNVHLNYASYTARYDAMKKLLLASGIRHIRTSISLENPQPTVERIRDLGKAGIKTDLLFDSKTSDQDLRGLMQAARPGIEIVEGANEFDQSHTPDWTSHVTAYQQRLYSQAKRQGLGVIGPSMTTSQAYEQLGDLHRYLDYGNMHNYFSGFNPGTVGWGGAYRGALYGSLAYNVRLAKITAGPKPVMSTETGYCTLENTRNAVTPAIAARYLPRLFLEQRVAGVARTYLYEFLDEGQPGCDSHLGLLTAELDRKPGYTAVASLTRLLTQSGDVARRASIGLRLGGMEPSMRHLLVQNDPHLVRLFLWNETPSWDVNDGTGKPVAVASKRIDFAVAAPWNLVRAQRFGDDGRISTLPGFGRTSASSISVGDYVSVLELRNN